MEGTREGVDWRAVDSALTQLPPNTIEEALVLARSLMTGGADTCWLRQPR